MITQRFAGAFPDASAAFRSEGKTHGRGLPNLRSRRFWRSAPPPPRRSSSSVCPTAGCAASPAATAARSRRDARASAACATTKAASCKVPWGYVGALQCDPIEKKPFFHALPGLRRSLLRDARLRPALRVTARTGSRRSRSAIPMRSARRATSSPRCWPSWRSRRARPPSSRPTTSRSSRRSGRCRLPARQRRGLRTAYVSNGNGTPQVLDYIRPVDRLLQGRLEVDGRQALPAARRRPRRTSWTRSGCVHAAGDLAGSAHAGHSRVQRLARRSCASAARFIASVSRDIPWHVTAFHPDYKMNDRGSTPAAKLVEAAEIGTERGTALRLRRQSARAASGSGRTRAVPNARTTVIERSGFRGPHQPLVARRLPPLRHADPGRWDPRWKARRGPTASRCPSSDRDPEFPWPGFESFR